MFDAVIRDNYSDIWILKDPTDLPKNNFAAAS
jgi:hypothetical protein